MRWGMRPPIWHPLPRSVPRCVTGSGRVTRPPVTGPTLLQVPSAMVMRISKSWQVVLEDYTNTTADKGRTMVDFVIQVQVPHPN